MIFKKVYLRNAARSMGRDTDTCWKVCAASDDVTTVVDGDLRAALSFLNSRKKDFRLVVGVEGDSGLGDEERRPLPLLTGTFWSTRVATLARHKGHVSACTARLASVANHSSTHAMWKECPQTFNVLISSLESGSSECNCSKQMGHECCSQQLMIVSMQVSCCVYC